MKTQFWVPGAAGMLGQELVRQLRAQKMPVLTPDQVELDISNPGRVLSFVKSEGVTHILNAAAYTAVDKAEEEPEAAAAINGKAAGHLATAAAAASARLVHVSTDYVFDGEGSKPYSERDPCTPLGVYGKTKRQGEEAVLRIWPEGTLVIRTSWLFGAGGNNFVKTMLRLMADRQSLSVVADQHGRPTAATDLAAAMIKASGTADGPRPLGILHFANQGATTWHGFATAILAEGKAQGMKLACDEVKPITTADYPTPAPRPAYSVLGTERIEAVLGQAPRPWQEALKDVVAAIASAA